MSSTIGDYKGKQVIILSMGTYPNGKEKIFTFGISKAKAILENLEEIRDFVKNQK